MVAVGVDACKTGWIAVAWRGGEEEAFYLPSIDRLTEAIPEASGVGIDIPIGLPAAGPREADLAARRFLAARRSSVFMTPIREALAAPSYAEATALSQRLIGSGISRQAYALGPKIFEVEAWLPTAGVPVWEVSPEIAFALLLGRPAAASKKTWAGMSERRDALAGAGLTLAAVPPEVGARGAVDDVLDAAVAAWSARRLLAGTGRSFPDPTGPDGTGRVVAIWG